MNGWVLAAVVIGVVYFATRGRGASSDSAPATGDTDASHEDRGSGSSTGVTISINPPQANAPAPTIVLGGTLPSGRKVLDTRIGASVSEAPVRTSR